MNKAVYKFFEMAQTARMPFKACCCEAFSAGSFNSRSGHVQSDLIKGYKNINAC
jgi:hypothetical protein